MLVRIICHLNFQDTHALTVASEITSDMKRGHSCSCLENSFYDYTSVLTAEENKLFQLVREDLFVNMLL